MSGLWRFSDSSGHQIAKDLACRQSGRVARYQLTYCGVGAPQMRSWLRTGYLIHRLPGVYAVGNAAPSVQSDLIEAVLYAGPGAMLTGATGAWWLGLSDHKPVAIEIATPRRRASLDTIHVFGRRNATRIWHRDLPVAPVVDVLLDYATHASIGELRRALAQAEYHGYVEVDLLLALLRPGKPGSRGLRRALAAHDPRLARVRSLLEIDFLELCATHGIPPPEVNVRIEGIEVDMLWRADRVVVELDGGGNHRTAAQMHRDRENDLLLRRARYVIQRYSRPQVRFRALEVAQDVLHALSRAEPWR